MSLTDLQNIENEKNMFKDLTHQLSNYNEIFNLNTYLIQSGKEEQIRLQTTNEMMKGKIMKIKQEYVFQYWKIEFMKLKNKLMYFCIFVTAILLIVAGLFLKKTIELQIMIIISVVISLLFIIVVVMSVKSNSDRRNIIWDQYYFPPMQTK